MTREQRETIREVIGHLWTLDGPGEDVATVSGSYAQDLIDLLAYDKPEEEKPQRGITLTEAARVVANYLNNHREIALQVDYLPDTVKLSFKSRL